MNKFIKKIKHLWMWTTNPSYRFLFPSYRGDSDWREPDDMTEEELENSIYIPEDE